MGSLVDFSVLRRQGSQRRVREARDAMPVGPAEILLFLGVRYERPEGDPPTRTLPPDAPSRGGRGGSRRA